MEKNKYLYLKFLLSTLLLIFSTSTYAGLPPLIPRDVLFGNPVKAQVKISPDGKWYSYLAPSDKNVLNVWLQDINFTQKPIMITQDTKRGIRIHAWAKDNQHIFYFQDQAGNENNHLYAVNIFTKTTRDLTPYKGVRATGLMLNKDYPHEILVGLNLRDRHVFDMYRIDLVKQTSKVDTVNPGDVEDWLADKNFQIRAALASNDQDGSSLLRVRETINGPWHTLMTWPFGNSGAPLLFSKDGKTLTIESNLHSDTTRLEQIDASSGKILKVLASNPNSDLDAVVADPNEYKVQAVQFDYLKPSWVVLDPSVQADFTTLLKFSNESLGIESRDLKDDTWIVSYSADINPVRYYVYDRTKKSLQFLFAARPQLQKFKLATMHPIIIPARDGFKLVAYLTTPIGIPAKKLPLVLNVHGGPWARDEWGYNSEAQWFANRGYAVLQLNYRGSTGFGKRFLNAGNAQWGRGAMQNDLTDAVAWAIKKGIADPKKVCIYGASYGGYATLAGLTFTPQLYACGIDIVGPSDLKTLLATVPPYWKTGLKEMTLRIGAVNKDAEFNQRISPLFHAEAIQVPLLIAQGANDPRVKIAHSNSIVKMLREHNIPVTYVVYTDEGHGFARPENRLDFYGRAEEFLAKVLGGRNQPWEKIPGSSATEE